MLRASQASGERPRSHSASFFTRAVMSTTTAPAKRGAAGPASTCQSTVAPSDQPTPIAPSKIQRLGQLGDVGRHPLDGRPRPRSPREAPCPRRSMAMIRNSSASGGLAGEEAAMRHQPVQQHDRRAAARVPIGDSRPVRSGESRAKPLPKAARAPCSGFFGQGRSMA